jgi:lipid A ethanolaminephosphotransferase
MAPDAQTHIGAFIWFGENNKKEVDVNKEYSQDNLFHTLLGVFDVKSEVYNRDMDILK